MEGLDVEFERREFIARGGKGSKDRVTVLPENLIQPLRTQLESARLLHQRDLAAGLGAVHFPFALVTTFPNANRSWGWQFVFPAPRLSVDPRSGEQRRHHVLPQSVQRAVSEAARRAGIDKPCSPHVFRLRFATRMLQSGYDIRTVQELLGHSDVSTTLITRTCSTRAGRVC
jgi:site-specific recombinase XerD